MLPHKIYDSCFILVDVYLLRPKQGKYWNYKKENLLAISILFSKQGQNNCFNDYDITEIWYNISIISSFDIENVKQLWAVYMAFPFIPTNQAKLQFARQAFQGRKKCWCKISVISCGFSTWLLPCPPKMSFPAYLVPVFESWKRQ